MIRVPALPSTLTRVRDDDENAMWLVGLVARWRPGWHDQAACRGMDPALFFPENSGHPTPTTLEAFRLCAACPVRDECREAGRDESWGIWGGTSASSRVRGRARRRRARVSLEHAEHDAGYSVDEAGAPADTPTGSPDGGASAKGRSPTPGQQAVAAPDRPERPAFVASG